MWVIALLLLLFASESFGASAPITDFGTFTTTCNVIGDSAPCFDIRSYSGPTWDSTNSQMLWFGGGHAATVRNSVFKMNSSGVWTEMYNSTTCAEANSGNLNGTNLTWTTGASGPYPRPISRHVYDNNIYHPGLQRMIVLAGNNGSVSCTGISDATVQGQGRISHFDPVKLTWTITSTPGLHAGSAGGEENYASEYDPVSTNIIIWGYSTEVYNPVTGTRTMFFDPLNQNAQDEAGNPISSNYGYANDFVYYPPDDKFYGFDTNNQRVWRITPPSPTRTSSTSWAGIVPVRLNHTGTYPTQAVNNEPGYAYDPVSQQICGALSLGTLSCFKPSTKVWTQITTSGSVTNATSEMHGVRYDTANNRFIIVGFAGTANSPFHTYAITGAAVASALGGGGGDSTNPTVTIAVPATNTSTTAATYTLTGTASDNVGVTSVTCFNTLAACSASGTTSWSITNTSLAVGDNIITITAHDAAGNLGSATRTITRTSTTGTPEEDFANRCKAAGVVFCNGFDAAGDLGTYGFGNWKGYGAYAAAACGSFDSGLKLTLNCPTIDSSVKTSGNGAMHFTIPVGQSGITAGEFWQNFSQDLLTQYGASQTFYVQYRVRYDANAINAGNYKTAYIDAGDKPGCTSSTSGNPALCKSSCQSIEFNTQTNSPTLDALNKKYPGWYSGCPGTPGIILSESVFGTDFTVQNQRPNPYCLRSQGLTSGDHQFPPDGNCFGWQADDWTTMYFKMSLGPRGSISNDGGDCQVQNLTKCFYSNDIQIRMGRNGQPTEAIENWTGPINAGYVSEDIKFGKMWINTYTGTALFPNGGNVYYDELIVSTQPIADPGAGAPAHVFVPVNFKIQ